MGRFVHVVRCRSWLGLVPCISGYHQSGCNILSLITRNIVGQVTELQAGIKAGYAGALCLPVIAEGVERISNSGVALIDGIDPDGTNR